jgi:hypothetical protein
MEEIAASAATAIKFFIFGKPPGTTILQCGTPMQSAMWGLRSRRRVALWGAGNLQAAEKLDEV